MPLKSVFSFSLALLCAGQAPQGHGQAVPMGNLNHAGYSSSISDRSEHRSVPIEGTVMTPTYRSALVSNVTLPDAPEPQLVGQQTTRVIPPSEDQARVSGLVVDPSGASVVGAEVTLSRTTGSQQLTLTSSADGRFVFGALPADSYVITIHAKGFSTYISAPLKLSAQQGLDLPKIGLSIATADTEVTVRPTEVIAAEQLRSEEKQRVFGVFPNFFTSYARNPAPLTAKQKFSLTAHDTFDPISLLGVAGAAGIEQANRTYPGYGNDAPGFGKRFGAALGDTLTNDFFSHAIFPALLHQDPRYYYQGSGTKKQRFYHAISFAVVTRSDSGHMTPNLSYLLGDLASGGLSNLYYPHADRGVGLVFTKAAIGIGGQAAGALVREFFSKRVTTNVPASGTP